MADALDVGDNVIEMAVASDGSGTNSLFLAIAEGAPVVEQINTAGTSLQTCDGTSGCYASSAAVLNMVADTNSVVMSLDGGVFVHFDRATGGCTAYDTTNGLPTSFVGDVALYGGAGLPRHRKPRRASLRHQQRHVAGAGLNGHQRGKALVAMVGVLASPRPARLRRRSKGPQHRRNPLAHSRRESRRSSAVQPGSCPSNPTDRTSTSELQQGARKWDKTS